VHNLGVWGYLDNVRDETAVPSRQSGGAITVATSFANEDDLNLWNVSTGNQYLPLIGICLLSDALKQPAAFLDFSTSHDRRYRG